MPNAVLLAAGIGDLIEGLIPFLFVAIWIISQVFAAFRKAAKAPKPPVGGPQVRQAPPAQGRPPELDREIEEILRRTLGVEPARQAPPPPRPPKQQTQKPKQKKQGTGTAPRMPERNPRGSRDDVARHVQEAFAHDLAHESPSGTALQVMASSPSPGADLIAALRSPDTLRQLMIVREILDVPTHRW